MRAKPKHLAHIHFLPPSRQVCWIERYFSIPKDDQVAIRELLTAYGKVQTSNCLTNYARGSTAFNLNSRKINKMLLLFAPDLDGNKLSD